ncbi:hypothetical protein Taro_039096 [Colocasia esculenta]|uniref:Uncharacterized protein n=1 Tax=Colocasia esculenta TaxID=4460 RepID=A0A843WP56_COLES|nr:hypothetical protein [Colocasia esculenta]
MEKHWKLKASSFQLLLLPLLLSSSPLSSAADPPDGRQTYIVHVHHPHPNPFTCQEDREKWHRSFLPPPPTGGSTGPQLLYSYEHVISGFAAKLTEEELRVIQAMPGFVQAHRSRLGRPQTTYSPQFLGLPGNAGPWSRSNYGEGIIIGMLDTGILPTHPSFSDAGMPPPPKRWKGSCEFLNTSWCNNKIIGSRIFASDEGGDDAPGSAIDDDGHGTHTASIAAGVFVKGAAVLGSDKGTAAGVAPRAHIAVYKICILFCDEKDVLKGMDQAITDGVDVIAYTVNFSAKPFYEDSIAIASLRAAEKGVFVSCSAGNSGPDAGSVSNDFPWVATVGASTVDRMVKAVVKLGNGFELDGESVYQPSNFPSRQLHLIYPGGLNSTDEEAEFCQDGSLDKYDVRGKVVMCAGDLGSGTSKGEVVKKAGGAAMIFMNTASWGSTNVADADVLPAASLTYADGQRLRAYVKGTLSANSFATAAILFKGTQFGEPPSPTVASFSSRGPSTSSGSSILKPDVLGPGVNILGAYPWKVGPVRNPSASRLTNKGFAVLSGSSMSTPHIAGVAALLKVSHPDWSPAAIRSAIMTTADTLNRIGDPIAAGETDKAADFYATGAGHVNPSRAADPGLVYDIRPSDYLGFLCGGLGYTDDQLRAIARRRVNCSSIRILGTEELNYPSITVTLGASSPVKHLTRTVTNVGEAGEAYQVVVEQPAGVAVSVSRDQLRFSKTGEKLSFVVWFRGSAPAGTVAEGALKWVSGDGKRVVRSPISVLFK